jgi:hypothetical protein
MPRFVFDFQEKWKKPLFLVFFLVFTSFFCLNGQKSDEKSNFELSNDVLLSIEEYLESADGENTIDVLELVEYLEQISQSKLELNSLSREELNSLQLLSDVQVNNFFQYRQSLGPFISLYEIQAIPSFDQNTIQRILPFITLRTEQETSVSNIQENLSNAEHEIILRSQRNLETLAGSIEDNGFLGDPYRHFLRYRFKTENIQAGLLAEKDIGEEWFSGSNKSGFDFYSYHISIKNPFKGVNRLILGDYTVSMGQGLILHNQFGRGLSSFTTNIKKRNGAFRQYTARNEVNYFKGIALDTRLNDRVSFKVFGSRNKIDGNIRDLDDDGIFESFSSIDISGNHRSEREVLRNNQVTRSSFGGILYYETSNSKVSLNLLSDQFDKTFNRTLRPDNIFFPRQNVYNNLSLDFSHSWRGVNFFGESAYSIGNGTAHILGTLISLHPKLDLALIYRNYARDYAVITPNSFGQGAYSNNEKGTYLGIEYRFNNALSVNAYADFSKNPWLRFRIDKPGMNKDYLLKVNYRIKRKLNAYFLFKSETQLRNSTAESAIDFTAPNRLSKFRFHISQNVTRSIELRNRVEYTIFKNNEQNYKGILFYQDLLYRKAGSPLSLTSRFLWFDIQDFDARIYTYENDVLYDFFVPFFNGNGIRYYINVRYKISRPITLELRWAKTRFFDRTSISSGLTEIDGSVNTNVKAQLKIRF